MLLERSFHCFLVSHSTVSLSAFACLSSLCLSICLTACLYFFDASFVLSFSWLVSSEVRHWRQSLGGAGENLRSRPRVPPIGIISSSHDDLYRFFHPLINPIGNYSDDVNSLSPIRISRISTTHVYKRRQIWNSSPSSGEYTVVQCRTTRQRQDMDDKGKMPAGKMWDEILARWRQRQSQDERQNAKQDRDKTGNVFCSYKVTL